MELIYMGKTKNVYRLENGNLLLKLKDDATGKDGVFDPGENAVGLTIEGLGRESLRMSKYYFEMLNNNGVDNHFVEADLDNVTMTVKPAKSFGKGVEVVCRVRAAGSFIKRYGDYVKRGAHLDYLVEFTLKDDSRLDPPITKDALSVLNIVTKEQYDEIKAEAQKITKIIEADFTEKDLDLYDIKFEFGIVDGKCMLIDEISAGNMRVFKGNEWLQPLDLAKYFR